MRDIVLVGGLAYFIWLTIRYPYAGLLTWAWLTLMNPHQLTYGFAKTSPLNAIVAAITMGAWLLNDKKHRWPKDMVPWLMVAMVLWMTFNSFFAVNPDWSWPLWDRVVKIYIFIFLVLSMMQTKARIHAMLWIIVISIGFFGVKGGIFTIVSGGNYTVFGPPNSTIRDNNHLALAVAMTLPLIYYLMRYSENKWLQKGFLIAIPLQIATVLGSYSRGGMIALSVIAFSFWIRSRRKVTYLIAGTILLGSGLWFMPPEFYDRMHTITAAQEDASFMGRVASWKVATYYAIDHFPFGAGFAGPQLPQIYSYYQPDAPPRAAHSIYFQVLGEHGFPGLILFLLTAFMAWRNTRLVIKRCRYRKDVAWMHDLALMVEVALIGFLVGGAALSMAYYDAFLLLMALTSILRSKTEDLATEQASTEGQPTETDPVGGGDAIHGGGQTGPGRRLAGHGRTRRTRAKR